MRFAKLALTLVTLAALAAYGSDCLVTSTPDEAMQCCHRMPCSSHGHQHSHDCCKTMPSMHAPFVKADSAHGAQVSLERYSAQGFVVIGFKSDMMKDSEDPIRFAKRLGVRYPLAVATDAVQRKFGGIEGLPTTMIYDRQGVLRQKIIGFEYTETVSQLLKPLL
jgi:hypothetical protein